MSDSTRLRRANMLLLAREDRKRSPRPLQPGPAWFRRERRIHVAIGVAALLLFLLLVAGCGPFPGEYPAPAARPPERLPIISMQDVYPGGQTPEAFWGVKHEYFKDYESRKARQQTNPAEDVALGHLYELELVRRAGEANIREYNKFARERNQANGY